MKFAQTMCFGGYVLTQATNFHVTIKRLKDNSVVGHFQFSHELSEEELMKLAHFMDEMRETE